VWSCGGSLLEELGEAEAGAMGFDRVDPGPRVSLRTRHVFHYVSHRQGTRPPAQSDADSHCIATQLTMIGSGTVIPG